MFFKPPVYFHALLFCLLTCTNMLAQNNFKRYTTKELLVKAKKEDLGFLNVYPDKELNYAIPLIDSEVALKIGELYVKKVVSNGYNTGPQFLFPVGMQIQNEQIKNYLLDKIKPYDCLCADSVERKSIEYNKYSFSPVSSLYQYDAALANALYRQTDKSDTALLNHAVRALDFWQPFAWEYLNTITKPGFHQLGIQKRNFDPCVLASSVNTHLWVDIIHFITGKTEYASENEKTNFVYKRFARSAKKDPDEQKDLIKFGKASIINLQNQCNSLDTLNMETIPVLKEKFDDYKKKEISSIVLYTNVGKALLLLYSSEKTLVGFSKQYVGASSLYLLELIAPNTLQMTPINYRERFLNLY